MYVLSVDAPPPPTTPDDDPGDLIYSTLPGRNRRRGHSDALAVDERRSCRCGGPDLSSNFPTTPGAFDPSQQRPPDAFVVRLDADGSTLDYATFLGEATSGGSGLALDAAGCAVVTGLNRFQRLPYHCLSPSIPPQRLLRLGRLRRSGSTPTAAPSTTPPSSVGVTLTSATTWRWTPSASATVTG